MPAALLILLFLLTALGIATGVYWAVVLVHVRNTARLPTVRDGLALPGADLARRGPVPRVCVVIPAHNERDRLPRCAASLLKQDWPDLRIVFALDRCTDGTAEAVRAVIAGDPRAGVLEIAHCPEDWAGKVHACHAAVQDTAAAEGAAWLLFADADTAFDPGCVRAAVALAEDRRFDLLSVLSTLEVERWFERVAQPAAGVELLRQYPPLKVSTGPHARQRPFANGQFLLFARGAYDAVGGHAAARQELLEDIALARKTWSAGRRVGLVFADGMLTCKMYESWAQFRRGWKRIYTEAANRLAPRLRGLAWRLRITGTLLPAGAFLAVVTGATAWVLYRDPAGLVALGGGSAGLVMMAVALAAAFRMGRTPGTSIPVFPIGAWLAAGIMSEAARDLERGVKTQWAGRSYAREARLTRR